MCSQDLQRFQQQENKKKADKRHEKGEKEKQREGRHYSAAALFWRETGQGRRRRRGWVEGVVVS